MTRTKLMMIVGVLAVTAAGAVGLLVLTGDDGGTEHAASTGELASSDTAAPPSLLGVVSADGGSFDVEGDEVTVRLTGVDANATWFTDRPGRNAGTWPTGSLLERFWAPQAGALPNVALEVEDGEHHQDLVILELEDPDYDATAGTLEARGRMLDTPHLQMVAFTSRADDSLPDTFAGATMFIDNILPWVHEWCSVAVTNATSRPLEVSLTGYNRGHQSVNGDFSPLAPGDVRTIWGEGDSERDCDLAVEVLRQTGDPVPGLDPLKPASWSWCALVPHCDLERVASASVHVPVTGSNSGSCEGAGGFTCWSNLAESQSAANQVTKQAVDVTADFLKRVAQDSGEPEIAFGISAFKLVFDYFERASKNVGALIVVVHE